MKKSIAIGFLIWLCSGNALQAQNKHEFSIYGGGGISTLMYDVNVTGGSQKMGFGGHFGLGYQFFFSPNWGLGSGVELTLYNSKFEMNNTLETYYAIKDPTDLDPASQWFDFISRVSKHEEKQRPMFIQIPLMLQFQTNGANKFFASIGGKVGIPISKTYESTATLLNGGYFGYENYDYDTRAKGFGLYENRPTKGDMSLKPAFLASAELGLKWRLSPNWSLYTGAYVDYGINNIQDELAPLVVYNMDVPSQFAVQSVVNAQYTPRVANSQTQSFTDKVIPFAVGLKLRLAFSKGAKSR